MKNTIKAGDVVAFKPEWQDPGDDRITFRAVEDECEGSVLVVAELGLPINPTQRVRVNMIAEVDAEPKWVIPPMDLES